jgi:hypothetical protein
MIGYHLRSFFGESSRTRSLKGNADIVSGGREARKVSNSELFISISFGLLTASAGDDAPDKPRRGHQNSFQSFAQQPASSDSSPLISTKDAHFIDLAGRRQIGNPLRFLRVIAQEKSNRGTVIILQNRHGHVAGNHRTAIGGFRQCDVVELGVRLLELVELFAERPNFSLNLFGFGALGVLALPCFLDLRWISAFLSNHSSERVLKPRGSGFCLRSRLNLSARCVSCLDDFAAAVRL